MCDIITHPPTNGNLAEYCIRGGRHYCRTQECPNRWVDLGATATRLCDFHVNFCRHCAGAYCSSCIAAHQASCSMRPSEQSLTLWERVKKTMTEAGMGRRGSCVTVTLVTSTS